MKFVFINMAGETLFVREDAERAQWTQEEMSLELEFPFDALKTITIGQRVFFIDPSTGRHQIYEIKQARTLEPDGYQSITAEHICISELSDEHKNIKEKDEKTASKALSDVLKNTQWSVGEILTNPKSSCDKFRGSAWQYISEIKTNWNVYIEPNVTLSSDGTITRRLDIIPTSGVWNGVRLSVDKNLLDPAVTFDDSETVTALYGYGGTTEPTKKTEKEKEIDFADVVWKKKDGHPAKPKGQKYLEDPDATLAYGRNGRPRFGYYQNTNILDPDVLINKTWEALKISSVPDISVEGTVADLYRLGYADQPIKLHDIALVEVKPSGFKKQIQIIRMTVDLLDPTSTTLTLGSYIPNIIYLERQTEKSVNGGGGGGNKSPQTERSEYETAIEKNNRMIVLRAYQNDLDDLDNDVKLQEARIDVLADRITTEVTDRRNADGVLSSKITQTATEIRAEVKNEIDGVESSIVQTADSIRSEVKKTAEGLSSSITQTATEIRAEVQSTAEGLSSSISQTATEIRTQVTNTAEGLQSQISQNASEISLKVSKNGVISSINQTPEAVKISASKIELDGDTIATWLETEDLQCTSIECSKGTISVFDCDNKFTFEGSTFTFGSHNVSWQQKQFTTYNLSESHAFMYKSGNNTPTILGRLITSTGTTTIYYLGR